MSETKCPPIDPHLLRWLDEQFPERSPQKNEEFGDLRWRGGQRSVVSLLKRKFEDQEAH